MFKSETSFLDIMQITYQYSSLVRKWSAKSLCGGSVIISYSEASILFKCHVKLKNFKMSLFALKCICISKWPRSLYLVPASISVVDYSVLSQIALLFDLG